MIFIEVKALAGMNHVRAADVLAVLYNDPQRCTVILRGGATVACAEAAKDIVARIETAMAELVAESKGKS